LPLIEYMGREVKKGDFRFDFLGKASSGSRQKLYAAAAALASTSGSRLDGSLTDLQVQEYRGVVAQLTDVVVWARALKDVAHEKYLTPLLSRTNYGLYPDFIRLHPDFKKEIIDRAAILLDKAANITLTPVDPFLTKSTPQAQALSVGQWIQHIIRGEDPLFWGQKRGDPRWNPQLVGPSRNRGWATVFEFRGIAEGLPASEWKSFSTARVPFIAGLNDDLKTSSGVNVRQYGARYSTAPSTDEEDFDVDWGAFQSAPPKEEDDTEWGAFQSAPPRVPQATAPARKLVRSNSFTGVAPAPRLLRTNSLPTLPSASRKDG
jgi:hypothetical protein